MKPALSPRLSRKRPPARHWLRFAVLIVCAFALFAATIVAGIAAREPALLFALLGLFALVDAVGDVATAFLDPRDLPLLRSCPIEPGEYVRARLMALALPIGVKTLALGLPTAAALIPSGAGARAAAAFFVAFAAMTMSFSAIAVFALLLLRKVRPGQGLHVGLAWLRAALLVSATAGWLLLFQGPRGEGESGSATVLRACESALLPTSWFAGLYQTLAGIAAASWTRVAAALGTLVASALGVMTLTASYVRLLEALAQAPPPGAGAGAPRGAFERTFVAPEERPAFRLGVALLRRERTFRLETLPLLAYPLLFLALGRGADDGGLFALIFAQLPALVLAIACVFLRFSDSPAGGFALRFLGRAHALEAGARKALWYAVALPLSILVTALLAWDQGLVAGIAVGATGLFSSTLAVVTLRSPEPELPFVERFRGRIAGAEGGGSSASSSSS